jgi:hypothetical protein
MLYVAKRPDDILGYKKLGLIPIAIGQVFLSALDAKEYMAEPALKDSGFELYGVLADISQTYTYDHQTYYLKYAVPVIELDEFGGIKCALSA